MKFWTILTVLASSCIVDAFPPLSVRNLEDITPRQVNEALKSVERLRLEKNFTIDFRKPIDITSRHAFRAPDTGDQRGPCPGLNALANHGYISHDGVTSFAEVVLAINIGLFPPWNMDCHVMRPDANKYMKYTAWVLILLSYLVSWELSG